MIWSHRPPFASAVRLIRPATAIVMVLTWSGCASQSYHAVPLAPEATAAAFDARSLRDDGLVRFLHENLQRDFTTPPATWDIETLAWVAFYYHPALDLARAQWEVARAGEQSAAARPNPTLVVTPGYDTSASGGVSPWLPAIAADIIINSAGKRELRTAMAQHENDATHHAVFAAAWNVRSELRQAVIAWGYAQARAESLRAQSEIQRAALAALTARFEAGAIDAATVAPARLALVRAETVAAETASQLPGTRQRLAAALGLPGTALDGVQLEPPSASSPMLSIDLLATRRGQALQSRPDVLAALAHYAATESALELEIARQRPDFHLSPGYQWDQGDNKWTLGLSLELPLFNHNEGPIAEAVARRREAAAQFLTTQAAAIAEIDGAAATQAGTAAQLAHLRRARDELRLAVTRTQARFDAGAADQLDVQNAHLELAAAATAVLDAEEAAALAAGRLEDALQIPFARLPALDQQARELTAASSP